MPPESPSTSGIQTEPSVELSFSLGEVMAAKALVRTLIRRGLRKGPVDLLVVSDLEYDRWLEEDAIRWLREQKHERSKPTLIIH